MGTTHSNRLRKSSVTCFLDMAEELMNVLQEDLKLATNIAIANVTEAEAPYYYRTLTRTFFCAAEGTVFALKRLALEASKEYGIHLTREEQAILCEETYYLNDGGFPKTGKKFYPLASNFLFAARCVAKAFGVDVGPTHKSEGLESFKKAISVRNRITHPKDARDLRLSEDDAAILQKGSVWFHDYLETLFETLKSELEQMAPHNSEPPRSME